MVLVDSSIWIPNLRRDGPLEIKVAVEALLEEQQAAWCGPVKLEVLGGVREELRRKLEFWFDVIPYREMRDGHWDAAKRNAWRLRDEGLTVPWNDVLIATLALDWQMRVYAHDAHFAAMAPLLGLSLYVPGYGGRYEPGDEAA
jgi:predicted nucleic acid-binding protein